MTFLQNLHTLTTRFRTYRQQIRTEQMIANLPLEIRRDIGWPDPVDFRERLNRTKKDA